MQCSYDSKGNSVPTILLLMKERLYSQEGRRYISHTPRKRSRGMFERPVEKGIVPDDIDVRCLVGVIKAWFRELPLGVLDGFSPEPVLQCNSEEDFVQLVKQLKPTECALLNKVDARNIAMGIGVDDEPQLQTIFDKIGFKVLRMNEIGVAHFIPQLSPVVEQEKHSMKKKKEEWERVMKEASITGGDTSCSTTSGVAPPGDKGKGIMP
ncbi:hypothetical protein RIF29_11280 [Crotalaria pallida]|uniref:Rho-GAP domain-containing protein n=1 Tax=Crotalaria pallida TaxID=3830 RepID=A0AAN9P0M1_CROPI